MTVKKKILVIDDDESVCEFLIDLLNKEYTVISFVNPRAALEFLDKEAVDLVLLDIRMPEITGEAVLRIIKDKFDDLPVIMVTAIDDLKTAVRCIKAGAFEYLTKPFHIDEIRHTIKHSLYVVDIEQQLEYYKKNAISRYPTEFRTNSPKMKEILNIIHKIADQNVTVLLTGESGVGKEVIANYIHNISNRKDKPFIAIDCGAIPPTLIQSELFGYERGAFTGANSTKRGKIELANNGTLFLDEINNMDFDSQSKLLRVIQSRKIERLGGSALIDVDARLIVASNKNLWHEVENKRFREDLYYRINVIPIHIPPLRERREDIELLCETFIEQMNRKNRKNIRGISADTIELFKTYEWPGNIRELENMIEKAVILTHNTILQASDFGQSMIKTDKLKIRPLRAAIDNFEREYITKVLRLTDNNLEESRRILEIDKKTLNQFLKKYEIVP